MSVLSLELHIYIISLVLNLFVHTVPSINNVSIFKIRVCKWQSVNSVGKTDSRPLTSRDVSFEWSRGADALPHCDRKHGCALEISAIAKVFAFGLTSRGRDTKNRPFTQPVVQRSFRRQQEWDLLQTNQPDFRKFIQVRSRVLAGVAPRVSLKTDMSMTARSNENL